MKTLILKVALIAAFLPLSGAIAETTSTDLSQRYVELRPGVLGFSQSASRDDSEKLRLALASLTEQALSQARSGLSRDVKNPEWKRISAIIQEDIDRAIRDLENDPLNANISRHAQETFARGIGARFSAAELKSLIEYYSSEEGKYLAGIQQKIFDGIGVAVAQSQINNLTGDRSRQGNRIGSMQDAKEILSLLDEWVRIQWALADPGPSGDRSGLQAISMMALTAFQQNYESYAALWQQIPENHRRAILARRESPIGRKERVVIFESAKALRAVIRPEEQMMKLMNILIVYEKKWRELLQ